MKRLALCLVIMATGCAHDDGYYSQSSAEDRHQLFQALQASGQQISNGFRQNNTPMPAYSPPPQIDYQCLNRCTQGGYMYQFCQSRCSY